MYSQRTEALSGREICPGLCKKGEEGPLKNELMAYDEYMAYSNVRLLTSMED